MKVLRVIVSIVFAIAAVLHALAGDYLAASYNLLWLLVVRTDAIIEALETK